MRCRIFPPLPVAENQLPVNTGNTDNSLPVAKVTWFQGAREITRDSRDFRQTFDGEKAEMEIAQVFPDDEGEFSCHVMVGEEVLTTKCYLLVKGEKTRFDVGRLKI